MLKTSFTIAAATTVAACASTASVLEREPNDVIRVAQPAAEVAFCLADKNNTTAQERADGSRVILVKNAIGAVGLAFTVRPEGNGSVVEYRREIGFVGPIWRQCVGLT